MGRIGYRLDQAQTTRTEEEKTRRHSERDRQSTEVGSGLLLSPTSLFALLSRLRCEGFCDGGMSELQGTTTGAQRVADGCVRSGCPECSQKTAKPGQPMRLCEMISATGRLAVAPLVGYPGARLTGTPLKENLLNADSHIESVRAIHDRWRPDLLLPMMDLAVEAGALGLPLRFPENESPTVEAHPIRSAEDMGPFQDIDILGDARLRSFLETVRAIARIPDVLHGAYVVGPFTLAGLLMGASEAALATIRQPDLLHEVMTFCVQRIHPYADACVTAGADLVVYLEPTAVLLSPDAFREFSGQYVQSLITRHEAASVLHICGNTAPLIDAMIATGVDGLSLDACVDFARVSEVTPDDVVLIGNIDPVGTMGSSSINDVKRAVADLRATMHGHMNFVLSTGCDLPLETPIENIDAFMRAGREES